VIQLGYILRRLGVLVLVVWVAATLSFLMPRLAPVNPIRERLLQAVSYGGAAKTDMEKVVAYYESRFGLDQPLWKQYLRYMYDVVRLDFGVSITSFPAKTTEIILKSLPWTLVFLTTATLIAFVMGTLLGALLGWPKVPRVFQFLVAPLLTLSSIPYYLLGLILVFVLAFTFHAFPLRGGYTLGMAPSLSLSFLTDAAYHSILPALSIVLSSVGFWALGMRAMMITTLGEDYITLAEAKGLGDRRIFLRYALRNALLPQTTSLALSMGNVVSGAVLVEVVFGYPGVGTVLYRAIQTFDYFLIYGVVLMIIISIGLVTFVVDVFYPLLDPRISYHRK
jgi:peptide/nickel transport system permease protein